MKGGVRICGTKLKTTLIDSELGLKETFATLKSRLLRRTRFFYQVTGVKLAKNIFSIKA